MSTFVGAPSTHAPSRGVGAREPRREDERLLRGAGRFVDDLQPGHMLHMAVGRCPYPHARLLEVDVSAALDVDGVVQVLVGSEVAARARPITQLRSLGSDARVPAWPIMAVDVACFEGQPVVSVVARDRRSAEDALELIDVDYDPLPHVVDTVAALADGAPVIHPELDGNLIVANRAEGGERAVGPDELRIAGELRIGRVCAAPMEGRVVLAEYARGTRELTIHCSTQTASLVRKQLAQSLAFDEGRIRVLSQDVGGGFGLKIGLFPEDVIAGLHAIDTGRPVKWVEDRLEQFRASTHARESLHRAQLTATPDGELVAIEDVFDIDQGAFCGPFGPPATTALMLPGPYRISACTTERRVVVTNKTPVGPYRGYGMPESNFVREVLIDRLCRRLGRDPLELRLQNLLRPDELPWRSSTGMQYDSGEYARCLEQVAERIGYRELRARDRTPDADGRLRGVGLAAFIEVTGYPGSRAVAESGGFYGAHESVLLRANRSGEVELFSALSSFGQSSETTLAQVCVEVLGVAPERVRVHLGDTNSPANTGGFGSRTMIAGAGAVRSASERLRAKLLRVAAHVLELDDETGLEIAGDEVRLAGDPAVRVSLAEVADAAIQGHRLPLGEEPGMEATAYFDPAAAAFGYGAAAVAAAVDPGSGELTLERVVFGHDAGRAVNPQIVDGQLTGAIVQALGAALSEELVYDADTGQLLSGSMMDYFVPALPDVPAVELEHVEVPSPVTPFGVRGVGESGTIPIAAAVANAVADALSELGVEIDRLPMTAESIWRAIQQRQSGGSSA